MKKKKRKYCVKVVIFSILIKIYDHTFRNRQSLGQLLREIQQRVRRCAMRKEKKSGKVIVSIS